MPAPLTRAESRDRKRGARIAARLRRGRRGAPGERRPRTPQETEGVDSLEEPGRVVRFYNAPRLLLYRRRAQDPRP